MLDERTYPDKSVVKFAGQVVPLKIDVDRQGKVAARYGITGMPTILFLDYRGKVLGEFFGFRPPQEFITESMRVLKKRK